MQFQAVFPKQNGSALSNQLHFVNDRTVRMKVWDSLLHFIMWKIGKVSSNDVQLFHSF